MSSAPSSELSASAIISQIEAGAVGHEILISFARGFLPLETDDTVAVLTYLCTSPDQEIASLARQSLQDVPLPLLRAFAGNERVDGNTLRRLAAATTDNGILETLVRNRSLPDEAVVDLARSAEPVIQEVVVINQARILRTPAILDALLENPNLTGDARRRVLETREEFFHKKARIQPVEIGIDEELADAPIEPIEDLLEAARAEDSATGGEPAPPPKLTETEKSDPGTQALFARVLKMTVAEKVVLAFRGDKTARTLMVRERSKLVCSAAMRNPRMTDTEAEQIAGMRNVDDEVLRLLGMRRDWIAKYPIALALCRNPRAPVGVVLPLINRLTLRDLKGLKDDKGVSEVVRTTARRIFLARQNKS